MMLPAMSALVNYVSVSEVIRKLIDEKMAETIARQSRGGMQMAENAEGLIYAVPGCLPRALEIYKKYSDQFFSLTDCTSFAIIESLKIEEALAFERYFTFETFGFSQYKGLGRSNFLSAQPRLLTC